MSNRALTPGERAIVDRVFGGEVDAARVAVRHRPWWWFQPANVIMAPDGHLWCHPRGDCYRDDWSVEEPWTRAHFVHEMTHVWQHQRGVFLPLRRPPWARYGYRLKPGKPFGRYGFEQQAEIVRHAYLLAEGLRPRTEASLAELAALIPFWRR